MLVVDKALSAAPSLLCMFHPSIWGSSLFLLTFSFLFDRYPSIKKFIIQDLAETREAAESFIASKNLGDRIEFEVQDFFTPQKRNGKYVFVMQRVLHDWNTEDGAKMLRQIRDVMNKDVRASSLCSDPIVLIPSCRAPC